MYRYSNYKDKKVRRLSYRHIEIPYTGKIASLFWDSPLVTTGADCPHTLNKTASFQKKAMRTQVALWFFYEVKFV